MEALSLVVCSLAHWDKATRARGAKRILEVFAQEPEASLHSRLSVEWMSGLLNAGLVDLSNNVDFVDLDPHVQLKISEYFWVPIDETPIERPHAKLAVDTKKATRIGEVGVSLSNRWPLFTKWLQMDRSCFGRMVGAFSQARRVSSLANTFGLVHHPVIQTAYLSGIGNSQRRTRLMRRALQKVIYRVDLDAQFENQESWQKLHKKRQAGRQKQQETLMPANNNAMVTFEEVRLCAIREHFRAVASSAYLYSMPVSINGSGAAVQSLHGFLDQSWMLKKSQMS